MGRLLNCKIKFGVFCLGLYCVSIAAVFFEGLGAGVSKEHFHAPLTQWILFSDNLVMGRALRAPPKLKSKI